MEVTQNEEIVQMEFEGVAAQDSDVPSMSQLLNQLVKESGVNSEDLAKVLVSQNYIGSVLKPCMDDIDWDEGEDPEDQAVFAISTIVNITQRQEPVILSIQKFLRKYIRDLKVTVEKGNKVFEELISDNGVSETMRVGLLIKERMLNMPIGLLQPSLVSLFGDVEIAVKKNMPYRFTHFLYWSKMYIYEGQHCYYDVEDAWFEENSQEYFSYELKFADTVMVESGETAAGGQPIRRVYITEFSKLPSFLEHVKTITTGV